MRTFLAAGAALLALSASPRPALADDHDEARIDALEQRIEQLEEMNRHLLEALEAHGVGAAPETAPQADADAPVTIDHAGEPRFEGAHGDELVGVSPDYGFAVLDHAEGTNIRALTILSAMQDGSLDRLATLSGAVTVLADYQESNSANKFGWLMRHPTASNHIGETVSELVVHSAQLAFTGRLSDEFTIFGEILYDPEQSFGAGTITDLNRNQTQMRRAFVLWGDLDERPIYAAIGKMDTPFGLNDTVSPFTQSTNYHAFAGLAYGGMLGYYRDNLHLRAMAIQGGAQFRSHNAPVENTNVPSRLNNFALDANYTVPLGTDDSVLFGASYTHATAYCQGYPVTHFSPCEDNNPAWAAYAWGDIGAFELIGEYAQTTDEWPGTASPAPQFAEFDAVKVQAFTLGGRYWFDLHAADDFALSAEFSRFIAGEDDAPWERQDQFVLGGSYFVNTSVNLFGEFINARGWVPLNFLSGGNLPDGATHSESDAETNILALGVQAAF